MKHKGRPRRSLTLSVAALGGAGVLAGGLWLSAGADEAPRASNVAAKGSLPTSRPRPSAPPTTRPGVPCPSPTAKPPRPGEPVPTVSPTRPGKP
ncbi:hypothetical protein ACSNOI_32025, partial [Actinomadura kijaniata]